MNHTKVNNTLLSCGFAFLPLNPASISPDIRAVFIFRIAVNALTCPLIILLNILVMVAVKTKRQLRTKSNIALACLATTDLVVGLVVQPLQIASESLIIRGQANVLCTLIDVSLKTAGKCLAASLYHLFLMSAERYIAIKHTFAYDNLVTELRIIIASCLAWAAVIILPMEELITTKELYIIILVAFLMLPVFIMFPVMIYFNVAVYKEVRRNVKQIAANQVYLEGKKKLLKNKKAFYTTVVVLIVMFMSHIMVKLCLVILISFKDIIPANVGHIAFCVVTLLPVLSSLCNPLIYAVRIRYFRVAFIELLSRKTFAHAEELERKIFGPKKIGIIATAEQGHKWASREGNVQQVNETLNTGRN